MSTTVDNTVEAHHDNHDTLFRICQFDHDDFKYQEPFTCKNYFIYMMITNKILLKLN